MPSKITRIPTVLAATNGQAGQAEGRNHPPRAVCQTLGGTAPRACSVRRLPRQREPGRHDEAGPLSTSRGCFSFSYVDLERTRTTRRSRAKYIRVRPPDRPRKLTPVLPSLGMRAFPDPLPPAVVDELVERSSLPHRLRHRVERRTERALELFLRPLSYDVVSAMA